MTTEHNPLDVEQLIRRLNNSNRCDTERAFDELEAVETIKRLTAENAQLRQQNSTAINDVIAERHRQMSAEGWTSAHDDQHSDNSLAAAAACYALHYVERSWVIAGFNDGDVWYQNEGPPENWPESWHEDWWKPKNPRHDLVRAAALIVAEIDRIDRAAIKEVDESK